MLSKSTIKLIKSLQIKKFRIEHQLFLVEGRKSVLEILHSNYSVVKIVTTAKFALEYLGKDMSDFIIEYTDEDTLSSIGNYERNSAVLAIVKFKPSEVENLNDNIILALDTIQDPGNFGTIVRTADWFGIKNIICSPTTVDLYNPKVIAASMGSFTRINIQYCDLESKLKYLKNQEFAILGAFMDGKEIEKTETMKSVIIMGNEAQGVSENLWPLINQKISIRGIGNTESLNVAVASGIILHHFCNK